MSKCCGGPPVPPVFNLLCNVWYNQGAVIPVMPAKTIANLGCQLRTGELISRNLLGISTIVYLAVPKLTDLAGNPFRPGIGIGDLIECPAGSLRYYRLDWVDDVGKGFVNEYRVAAMTKMLPWPFPTP